MKRLVTGICMVLMLLVAEWSIEDFNNADSWLGVFKALFFLVMSVLAFLFFLDDFKKNRWPFND